MLFNATLANTTDARHFLKKGHKLPMLGNGTLANTSDARRSFKKKGHKQHCPLSIPNRLLMYACFVLWNAVVWPLFIEKYLGVCLFWL